MGVSQVGQQASATAFASITDQAPPESFFERRPGVAVGSDSAPGGTRRSGGARNFMTTDEPVST